MLAREGNSEPPARSLQKHALGDSKTDVISSSLIYRRPPTALIGKNPSRTSLSKTKTSLVDPDIG